MMSPYDPKFDFKIYIGQSDLHFTVQWFCFSDLAFLYARLKNGNYYITGYGVGPSIHQSVNFFVSG